MSPKKPEESGGAAVAEDIQVKEPPKFAVLLHNDDFTTMEFVIEVLLRFFRRTTEESVKIMLEVHEKGSGVAGIYPSEIAETKVSQVTEYAQASGYPLRLTFEPL
ncbi:MAG: ATP-dependent Clp protease adaptor ClpS [Cryobacterium sp.]|nr:ATP-dependent Clp protease adaptor ClpS [Oligoflexia bacterium]